MGATARPKECPDASGSTRPTLVTMYASPRPRIDDPSVKFFDLEYTTAGWVPVRLDWDNTPLDPGPGVSDWFQRSPGRFDSQRIVCKGGSGGTGESPQLDEQGRIHSARANDRVVGFNMLGGRWNHEVLLDWIDSRRSLSFVLDRLAEAQFDEELSPRWRRQPAAPPT